MHRVLSAKELKPFILMDDVDPTEGGTFQKRFIFKLKDSDCYRVVKTKNPYLENTDTTLNKLKRSKNFIMISSERYF